MPLNEWDDNSIPLPESQDLMRYELARKGSMPLQSNGSDVPMLPSEAAGQYVPVPIEKPQPYSTATNIYQAAADRLGLTAVPQALMAAMTSFPSEVAKGIGQPEASAALQYQPTSRSANELLKAYDEFHPLGSHMGAGPLPETWQLPASLTANDLRVVAKQNLERAREFKNIRTDFANAQSGIRRESNLGGNTYGANLQAVAEDIGDVAARQAARRSETGARPGSVQVFSDLVPETNMYAVRPVGHGQYIEPNDLPNGVSAVGKVPGNVVNQLEDNLKRGEDPESIFQNYYVDFIGATPHVDQAWQTFSDKKLQEMYPDAPTVSEARKAFEFANPEDLGHHARLKMLDEFSETPEAKAALNKRSEERQKLHDELYVLKNAPRKGMTEEQKTELNNKTDEIEELLARTPSLDLPTQAHVGKRNKAISEFFKKDLKNELVKWIGTGQGPTMELAKRGITHVPAKDLLNHQVNDPNSYANKDLVASRKAAGLPEQGYAGELLAKKEAELKTASDAFNKLNSRKNQLGMQHQTENPANPDPTTNAVIGAEYKELTNQIDNAYRAKEKLEKEAENLKVARAYEGLSDVAFKPTTAKEARQMDYARKQFYTNSLTKTLEELVPFGGMMEYPAIPDEAPMFNIRSDFIRDLGYVDLAKQYSDAIMKGEIPLDEKTGKPTLRLDKFIEEHTAPRIKKEEKERLAERNKIGNLNKYMKELVDSMPETTKFGNSKVIELTSQTPWEDIRRHTSLAGLVFDHCIAQSDAPHPGINPFTGQRYAHSYPIDPVTGKPRLNAGETDESVNHSSSYMRGTQKGEKRLAIQLDADTGMPVGAIEFRDEHNGMYNLGYIQSHKTDSIKKPYRDAFKDYLNARSDIINGIGSDLNKHDIFDMTVPNQVNKAFQAAGMRKSDISQLDLPRFSSAEDLQRAVPTVSTDLTAPDTHASLIARKNQLVDHIEEYRHDLRDAQRDDPTDHEEHERIQGMMDEARNQIADVNSRLENISNNVRNAPAQMSPRDIALTTEGMQNVNRVDQVVALTEAINNELTEIMTAPREGLMGLVDFYANPNQLPDTIVDHTNSFDDATRIANYLRQHAQARLDMMAPEGNQLAPVMNQVEAQRVRDAHLLQREGVQRGLSTAGNPANVRTAYHDILNDIDADATPEDAMHHLSIVHDIIQDPETDLHREFGIQDENQVGQLINVLERHMTAIEPQLAANRAVAPHPNPDIDRLIREEDNNISRAWEDVLQNAYDYLDMTPQQIRDQAATLRRDPSAVLGQATNEFLLHPGFVEGLARQIEAQAGHVQQMMEDDQEAPPTMDAALSMDLNRIMDIYGDELHDRIRTITNDIDDRINIETHPQSFINALEREAADQRSIRISTALTEMVTNLREANQTLRAAPGQLENDLAGGDWIAEEEPVNHRYNASLSRIDSAVAYPDFQFENYRAMHESIMNGNEEGTPWHNLSATERRRLNAYLDAQYTRRINGDLAPNNPPPEGHKDGGAIHMAEGGMPEDIQRGLDEGRITQNQADYIHNARLNPVPEHWGDHMSYQDRYNESLEPRPKYVPPTEQEIRMKEFLDKQDPMRQPNVDMNREQIRKHAFQTENPATFRTSPARSGGSGGGGYAPGSRNPFNPDSPLNRKKGGIIRMNQGGTPNPEDTYGTFSYTPDYYAQVADNISPEGRSGGYNDAARHVLAAADLTRRIESVPLIGKYIADPIVNAAGHVHEYANYLENIGGKKPQTIEDMQQDLHNNAVGRKLGAGSKSFQEIIDRTPAVLDVAPYRKEEGKVFVRNPNEVKTPYKPFGAFNEGGSVNTDDMRYELLRKN